ncbi:MAG: type II CAAX endopeptidase family protein [Dehalococcoidia bacterium]
MNLETPPASWGVRDVVIATVAAVALVLVVMGSVVGGLLLLQNVTNTAPFARPVSLGAILLYELGFLAIAVGFAHRRGGLAALGFRRFAPEMLLAVFGLLVTGFVIQIGYGLLLQALGLGQENPQRLDLLVGNSPLSLAFALLSASVVAPIAEETFFRGLVLQGLNGRLGQVAAVLVSSALFALSHLVPQVLPPIFLLGVFLALLRIWSGSLWPSIALHAAFNTVSLVAVFAASRLPAPS